MIRVLRSRLQNRFRIITITIQKSLLTYYYSRKISHAIFLDHASCRPAKSESVIFSRKE